MFDLNEIKKIVSEQKETLINLYKQGYNYSSLKNFEKGSIRTIEAEILYALIRHFKYKNILDIGTGKSFSSLHFCKALKDENLNGTVDSIDINQNFDPSVFKNFNLEQFFTFHQGKSEKIVPNFNKKFDFALIDGDHSYEATKTDFLNVFPKLNIGSMCAFHDVYPRSNFDGPRTVIDEIIKEDIGEVIFFDEELFDMFSYEEDIKDVNRMYNKWVQHNFSYASRDANPKELMAIFIKRKNEHNLAIDFAKNVRKEDEEYLKDWMV